MWNGAAPNLIRSLNIKIMYDCIDNTFHIRILVNNIILDPMAWIRKYLVMASISNECLDFIIGIKDNIFNSSDNQIINQLFDEIAIKVLITIINIIRNEKGIILNIRV